MSLSSPSFKTIDGAQFRFGIAAARFNEELVEGLLHRVVVGLKDARVTEENIAVVRVLTRFRGR
jgi:6,7-dimethyl-8-ribityllumazine synthase